ncbi:MAG: GUN4 domain-containing protein [Cyanobacteria bacterium P01_D01_bin.73]
MSPSQCPVCNIEITSDAVSSERCTACGWYLEPLSIPMTDAMAQFLASREEIQITWARDMWQKAQLQQELGTMGRDLSLMAKQLRRAHKERSQLHAQLLQLQDLVRENANALQATPASEVGGTEEAATSAESNGNGSSPASEAILLAAVQSLQQQMQQQWALLRERLPDMPAGTSNGGLSESGVLFAANGNGAVGNGAIAPPAGDSLIDSPFADAGLELTNLAIATDTDLASGENISSEDNEDDTASTKSNVSYRKLHKLLAAGKWADADRETTKLMLKVAGRSSTSWLRIEDIENFPAEDLQAIDRLWVAYSQEQFGFSIQKKLWQDIADGDTSQVEAWCQFGDSLGWLGKKKVSAGLNAPEGHLPSCSSVGVWWSSGLFLQVLEACNL